MSTTSPVAPTVEVAKASGDLPTCPDGYGVVKYGKVWMPVKWAPDAGEGAYRPLQSTRPLAPAGEPQLCTTPGEAIRWLREQLTPRQPTLSGELPAPKSSKPQKPAKRGLAARLRRKAS